MNNERNQVKCWFFFLGEGKPEYSEKTSRCRVENQQTQPTYDAESGNRTRATLVGGECSHHCAIPGPHGATISDIISWDTSCERPLFLSRAVPCPLNVVYRSSVTKSFTPILRGKGEVEVC